MSRFSLKALTSPVSSQMGMTHAVLQSVYNHAESTQNDRSRMNTQERGGNWSDTYLMNVGSRDWTLRRDKVTSQTLSLTKRFYEEALNWLIEEGYASAISVTVWKENANTIGRCVMVTLLDETTFEVEL